MIAQPLAFASIPVSILTLAWKLGIIGYVPLGVDKSLWDVDWNPGDYSAANSDGAKVCAGLRVTRRRHLIS